VSRAGSGGGPAAAAPEARTPIRWPRTPSSVGLFSEAQQEALPSLQCRMPCAARPREAIRFSRNHINTDSPTRTRTATRLRLLVTRDARLRRDRARRRTRRAAISRRRRPARRRRRHDDYLARCPILGCIRVRGRKACVAPCTLI